MNRCSDPVLASWSAVSLPTMPSWPGTHISWTRKVSELVRALLQFSPCERLLLEAGRWGTGIIREPRVRGISAVGSPYQATTGEHIDWEDLVRALVNGGVSELAIVP
jgi:hypothetical protein